MHSAIVHTPPKKKVPRSSDVAIFPCRVRVWSRILREKWKKINKKEKRVASLANNGIHDAYIPGEDRPLTSIDTMRFFFSYFIYRYRNVEGLNKLRRKCRNTILLCVTRKKNDKPRFVLKGNSNNGEIPFFLIVVHKNTMGYFFPTLKASPRLD